MKRFAATTLALILTASGALACGDGWVKIENSNACQMAEPLPATFRAAGLPDDRINAERVTVNGQEQTRVTDVTSAVFDGVRTE